MSKRLSTSPHFTTVRCPQTLYIYHLHELRIGGCRFRFGKGSRAALNGAPKEHGGAAREYGGVPREQGRVEREQRGAKRSRGTKRALAREQNQVILVRGRSHEIPVRRFYIYIIYTPNLGLGITVSVREREQGRFRGSIEGAGGAPRKQGGSLREQGGALREYRGAAQGHSTREPELAASYPAIAAHVFFNNVREYCCLDQPPAA